MVCRWCWIGIDRPAATPGRSVLDRELAGDRVYWKLYTPLDVVDWSFQNGKLAWVLTEESEYRNDDPRTEATVSQVRFLYEPGRTTRIEQLAQGGVQETPIEHNTRDVAFVPVGLLSSTAWWFDDVERIQRAILDKQSALDTAIFKAVFPLLVVPASVAEQAKMDGATTAEARRKIGIGNPMPGPNTAGIEVPQAVVVVFKAGQQLRDGSWIAELAQGASGIAGHGVLLHAGAGIAGSALAQK